MRLYKVPLLLYTKMGASASQYGRVSGKKRSQLARKLKNCNFTTVKLSLTTFLASIKLSQEDCSYLGNFTSNSN